MKIEFIKTRDNYNLELNIFEIENPTAVVQLVHGMVEHQSKYKKFVKFLTENNLCVVSSNLRGHGINAKTLGYFKDNCGDTELINDQKIITKYIKENYKPCLYTFSLTPWEQL